MIGLFLLGVGICICDPALQSYVGVAVPFAQRGQAIGLTEIAWAASSLVGIPLTGVLINSYSWNMPFVVIGLLGLVGTTLLRWLLPADGCSHPSPQPLLLLSICRSLLKRRPAQGMLWYAFLVSCAGDIFFVAYALWLAEGFQMGIIALGLATTAIGVAELSGELLTVTLADRLGLQRTMFVTLAATALCYLLLPLWSFSATGALIGIFLLCLAFEFNLVVAISLSTELVPGTRGAMMSSFQAASSVGHVGGALAGG
jgi:predicted MFS family arabinose efflux permease